MGHILAEGSCLSQQYTECGRAGRWTRPGSTLMTSFSSSHSQTWMGGPQAAVLASTPPLLRLLPASPVLLSLHLDLQLGTHEEAAKGHSGRESTWQVWRITGGIPTSLPGVQECLPSQCGQGGIRTLHHILPAPDVQDCNPEATAMAGPRHPVSVCAAALVETKRLQVRPYWSLPTSRRKEEGREGVHGLALPRCPSLSSNRHSPSLCAGRTTATPSCAGAGMSSGGST